MTAPRTAGIAGLLMIIAAVATNVLFLLLGQAFGYPDVLREPAAEILRRFAADQTTIMVLFASLAATAALLLPVAVGLGQLGHGFVTRLSVSVGVLAATVQVLGLLRWVYAVPVLAGAALTGPELGGAASDPAGGSPSAAAAVLVFAVAHQYLGVGVGEALGYLSTAAWTLLVLTGPLRQLRHPGALRGLGALAAAAIAAGVAEPFGAPAAGTVNFAGYLAWSLWLIGTGALLLRDARRGPFSAAKSAAVPATDLRA